MPPTRATHAAAVAPGVYLVRGAAGEVDEVNLGRVGNAGFIVGTLGVLAIDTGTSYQDGQALLNRIAEVTALPVRAALVTHTRQEFLFGTTAFQERGIPIFMHSDAAGLMVSRCDNCLKTLRRVLGDPPMQGSAMFTPDVRFSIPAGPLPRADPALDARLSGLIGRPVQVMYFGHSSGPGDVAVLDTTTRTLFAGGLLDQERIPDVQDSDLTGWFAALASLRGLGLAHVIPGHGPAATASVIDADQRYLTELKARLAGLLADGASLSEVPDATELDAFRHWDQYDTVHRRNASVVFLRLEREQLYK
jgi:glyoxylase-like metal-dependent hydrolase (beta-lactamase superfamily II)